MVTSMWDLEGFIDIDVIDRILKVRDFRAFAGLLKSIIKSLDLYNRYLLLNQEYIELTTCDYIYNKTGVHTIQLNLVNDNLLMKGNLTILTLYCKYFYISEQNNYSFYIDSLDIFNYYNNRYNESFDLYSWDLFIKQNINFENSLNLNLLVNNKKLFNTTFSLKRDKDLYGLLNTLTNKYNVKFESIKLLFQEDILNIFSDSYFQINLRALSKYFNSIVLLLDSNDLICIAKLNDKNRENFINTIKYYDIRFECLDKSLEELFKLNYNK